MIEPSDLAAIIAQVESNDNPQTLRYEPGLMAQWAAMNPVRSAILTSISGLHDCSHDTAHMIACTSWGRYQILGENLYERGLVNVTVFAYVADPKLERLAFDAFLIRKEIGFALQDIIDDETKRAKFIAAYNGPAGVSDYWARMQAAIARQSQ